MQSSTFESAAPVGDNASLSSGTDVSPAPVPPIVAVAMAVWTGLATAAALTGAAPVMPGVGWILGGGALLTAALFVALPHLPASEQPAAPTLAFVQGLTGLFWTTIYGWFAAPSTVLAPAMFLTTCLAVMQRVQPRVLLLLSVTATLGQALTLAAGASEPELAGSGFSVAALALVLAAVCWVATLQAAAQGQLEQQGEALRLELNRMARRAERDQLTHSFSRRYILDMLTREKARADRSGESFCVCLLDIDHFKAMNDQFGHLAGDRILASFCRRVRGELRAMDSVNEQQFRGSLGRLGGEEFLVFLPHTSLRGALRCAERIRHAVVRRPFNGLHQVTVSIGIAEYRPGEVISSLLQRADKALYGAKHAGRNRVHCATPDGGPSAIVMPDLPAVG